MQNGEGTIRANPGRVRRRLFICGELTGSLGKSRTRYEQDSPWKKETPGKVRVLLQTMLGPGSLLDHTISKSRW